MSAPCEFCKGKGRTGLVFISRGERGCETRESLPCAECNGTGRWSAVRHRAWRKGQQMRRARLDRGESLREAAKREGLTPAEMSKLERGAI